MRPDLSVFEGVRGLLAMRGGEHDVHLFQLIGRIGRDLAARKAAGELALSVAQRDPTGSLAAAVALVEALHKDLHPGAETAEAPGTPGVAEVPPPPTA